MNQIFTKPHPEINEIKRKKVRRPWLAKKVREWKWWLERIVKAYSLVLAFWRAKDLELLLQGFEQKRNNLQYASEKEQYLEMKGFCEGIKYCVKGNWIEEKDRSFLTLWRDNRLS